MGGFLTRLRCHGFSRQSQAQSSRLRLGIPGIYGDFANAAENEEGKGTANSLRVIVLRFSFDFILLTQLEYTEIGTQLISCGFVEHRVADGCS